MDRKHHAASLQQQRYLFDSVESDGSGGMLTFVISLFQNLKSMRS